VLLQAFLISAPDVGNGQLHSAAAIQRRNIPR